MTRSHSFAFKVRRMKPRLWGMKVYRSVACISRAISFAIRFSNPSCFWLEKGRLSGSAQTRISRFAAAAPANRRTASAAASCQLPARAMERLSGQLEHMHDGGGMRHGHGRRAPRSRIDGDALAPVGAEEGHRLPDDSRLERRLEQHPARAGVDGLEEPVQRPVEHHVTGGGPGSRPERERLQDFP